MMPHRYRLGLAAALSAGLWVAACGGDGDDSGIDPGPADSGTDSEPDDATNPDSGPETGPIDSGADVDAGPKPPDLPPGVVIDLAGKAGSQSATLTWTSPAGVTKAYEIRRAATPITTAAEFDAAENVTPSPPIPVLLPGSQQTATISGLTQETGYHFALRVKDGSNAAGPISNDISLTTLGRAGLLVSELAPANTTVQGGDFIELVATKAGSVAGLTVHVHFDGAPIHTFGQLDVDVGDRIVLHASGSMFPAGYAQEDTTKNKQSSTSAHASANAYDVYSTLGDLPPDGAVSVREGETYIDVVPYASRVDVDSEAGLQTLYDALIPGSVGAWAFSREDLLSYELRCDVFAETVNASGRTPSAECGGYPGFVVPGWSIQRNGVVDTNKAGDFFSAPQTRGAENAAYCAPETAKLAMREVNPRAGLVELSVVEGGRLLAFTLRANPQDAAGAGSGTEIASFPDACAATGDVVVVHLGASTPSETSAKNQHPKATHTAYHDGAWDFASDKTLTFASSVVLALRNPANAFVDVAALSDRTTATAGEYVASLRYVQERNLWLPADCGGQLCGGSTTPTAREVAADWSTVGATAATSIARTNAAFPSQAGHWSVGASSFGQ